MFEMWWRKRLAHSIKKDQLKKSFKEQNMLLCIARDIARICTARNNETEGQQSPVCEQDDLERLIEEKIMREVRIELCEGLYGQERLDAQPIPGSLASEMKQLELISLDIPVVKESIEADKIDVEFNTACVELSGPNSPLISINPKELATSSQQNEVSIEYSNQKQGINNDSEDDGELDDEEFDKVDEELDKDYEELDNDNKSHAGSYLDNDFEDSCDSVFEASAAPSTEARSEIWYQNRNILDLHTNLTYQWNFQMAALPPQNIEAFFSNRSVLHRLGPCGNCDELRTEPCTFCDFEFVLPNY